MSTRRASDDACQDDPPHTVQRRLTRRLEWVKDGLRVGSTVASTLVVNSAIYLVMHGPRRVAVRMFEVRRSSGRTWFVEDIPGSRRLSAVETETGAPSPTPPAPRPARYRFKARAMRRGQYPSTVRTFQYRTPPVSGKALAGVGEAEPRRVAKFFHAGYGHPFGAMERAFHLTVSAQSMSKVLKARWDNTRARGPVAVTRHPVADPAAMAAELKARALRLGAASVGCTPVTESVVFQGYDDYLPHAIVLAVPMDRQDLLEAPSAVSNASVIQTYIDVGQVAIAMAAHIRSLGWQAEADTNLGVAPSKVLHVPLAVSAGLGQMGRHTSLITREHGANVRLATVLTDIPIAYDAPVDIGVEDVCANCNICMQNCPPQAIYPEKVMVRGVEKWHLDFDRCMPYFVENEGCGVCVSVCPWSETDKGPLLSMLQQQRRSVALSYPKVLPESERLLTLSDRPVADPALARGTAEDYWQQAVIQHRAEQPGGVVEWELAAADGGVLPTWAAGAHTEIRLPSGKIRAYSLSNPPNDDGTYRLAIKVEPDGTGGSLEAGGLAQGHALDIKRPGNNVIMREDLDHYYLVAGGIGVTPLVPMAHRLRDLGKSFEVHYSVKDRAHAIYASELDELSGGRLSLHLSRHWLTDVFESAPGRAAVYVCGPTGLMDAVRRRAVAAGMSDADVHSEDFGSSHPDTAFDVVLASSGQRVTVQPGQTIATALGERGVYIPVSCGYGLCGVCTVGVLEGTPDARDVILDPSENNTKVTLCCSRSLTDELVIDI